MRIENTLRAMFAGLAMLYAARAPAENFEITPKNGKMTLEEKAQSKEIANDMVTVKVIAPYVDIDSATVQEFSRKFPVSVFWRYGLSVAHSFNLPDEFQMNVSPEESSSLNAESTRKYRKLKRKDGQPVERIKVDGSQENVEIIYPNEKHPNTEDFLVLKFSKLHNKSQLYDGVERILRGEIPGFGKGTPVIWLAPASNGLCKERKLYFHSSSTLKNRPRLEGDWHFIGTEKYDPSTGIMIPGSGKYGGPRWAVDCEMEKGESGAVLRAIAECKGKNCLIPIIVATESSGQGNSVQKYIDIIREYESETGKHGGIEIRQLPSDLKPVKRKSY